MQTDNLFFLNSILFGVGLAVDAFLVALACGMSGQTTGRIKLRAVLTATAFSIFQFAAPMLGWLIAHTAFEFYQNIELYFAWAAAAVIVFLGVRMLVKKHDESDQIHTATGIVAVLFECAATSVDALTVGFTIEEYGAGAAAVCCAIIASVTFVTYLCGFALGKKFNEKFSRVATVLGALVFFAIAVEIIVTTYI